jgi:hypothetical protein
VSGLHGLGFHGVCIVDIEKHQGVDQSFLARLVFILLFDSHRWVNTLRWVGVRQCVVITQVLWFHV